jgi:deoxyribodipyrimidine photolyase-related protein
LHATTPLPDWMWSLDAAGDISARCLATVLAQVRERGWTHHIPRLMVLGNYALQRGWDPAELTAWFHQCFVDGYDWVMLPNVVGMSQQADGGLMATKPYAAGGAYIDRMSDYCGGCRYSPQVRVGEKACPFTAGYWWFVDRHADRLARNPRTRRAASGRLRPPDLAAVVEQESARDSTAP